MVSIEELSLVVGIISGTIIPIVFFFMIRHLKSADNTSSKATMATFNIGSMSKEVNEIKDSIDGQRQHFDKRVDQLTVMMEKRDERFKNDIREIWDRLEIVTTDMKLHEYRLNKMDNNNNSKK